MHGAPMAAKMLTRDEGGGSRLGSRAQELSLPPQMESVSMRVRKRQQ